MAIYNLCKEIMKNKSQQERLLNFGISFLALGAFPLVWFLSQAILFRELTEIISRNMLVVIGLLVGSSFVFLLFSGMERLIRLAPIEKRDSLEARMFAGPSIFMIGLFLLYPAIRTIYFSFKDRFGQSFNGIENYSWAFSDAEMLVTIRNQIVWLVFVVFFTLFIGLIVGWLSDRLNKGEAFFKSIVFMPMAISAVGATAIFKFIYEYRPPPLTQIGIINGIRVSAGENCSNNRLIDGTLFDYADDSCNRAIGWLQQRDLSGLKIGESLEAGGWFSNLLVNLPLNTVLLLIIMEAGQIDGASEFKIFVSIVIPYIKSTIIVVGTYMVVTVLKAFDIIYVSTRGDLETNLLAVKMLDEFSKYRNIGRSSTVAVLIFICVIPIIVGNAFREKENSRI